MRPHRMEISQSASQGDGIVVVIISKHLERVDATTRTRPEIAEGERYWNRVENAVVDKMEWVRSRAQAIADAQCSLHVCSLWFAIICSSLRASSTQPLTNGSGFRPSHISAHYHNHHFTSSPP